jgi:hypothetical protein
LRLEGAGRRIAAMTPKQGPIQVVVEIEAAAEPIRGAVRTDGRERPFDGWMQLTAAHEDARITGAGGRADERAPASPSGEASDQLPVRSAER